MITLTIEQIERAIDLPVEEWKGKCYQTMKLNQRLSEI